MTITVTAEGREPLVLAAEGDLVTGLDVGDESVAETVRLFRRASAIERVRGGQRDRVGVSVERVFASHGAALAAAVALRPALRALRAPGAGSLTVTIAGLPAGYAATPAAVITLADAAVATEGPSRLLGVRLIQAYSLAGTIS